MSLAYAYMWGALIAAPALALALILLAAAHVLLHRRYDQAFDRAQHAERRLEACRQDAADRLEQLLPTTPDEPLPRRRPQPEQGHDQ